jgi:tetratricopeptide (TPR) repeat protein
MEETPDEKAEMIAECRKYYASDTIENAKILEFENSFTPNDAIQWYTRDSFLYRLFNKALRTQDVPFIYKFRFFLKNLYNQLAQVYNSETVHSQPISEVYRGQMIRIEELQQLRDSIGGVVSFHTFLSATRDRNVALIFAGNGEGRPFFESVVFCIQIFWEFHPYIETTFRMTNSSGIDAKPFADIAGYTYHKGEQEILFAMGATVEIFSVTLVDAVWYVRCKFYPGGTGNFLEEAIRSWNLILAFNPRVYVLGDFLLELDDYDAAIHFYVMSAVDRSDDLAVAWADYKLGRLYLKKDDCQTAFSYLQKAESLMLLNVSPTDSWLKHIFETIGDTFMKRGQQFGSSRDYELAVMNYKKALNTVTNQNSNEKDRRSSKFIVCRCIHGAHEDEIICAELYYKIFKAYHSMDDHFNGELFAELSLEILKSNKDCTHRASAKNNKSVAAIGKDSREINTLAFRQILFNQAVYIVEGAIIPDPFEICKRSKEFVQLTNDKEKKLVYCKFVADMCMPLYPNLYDILLFSHKYNFLANSNYEEDYSEFFMQQENMLGIDFSNMTLSYGEHIRNCLTLAFMEEMLKKRLNSEEPDELFFVQMMDFHSAMWIKRQDFLATLSSTQLMQDEDLSVDYNKNSILARNYSFQKGALVSINNAYKSLQIYQNQIELLLKTGQNTASLACPYRNIGRIYSNVGEYSEALENYEKCLEIAHTSMPSNESFLRRTYEMIENEIVELYLVDNAFSDAMNLMNKCLHFIQKYAAYNHSTLATTYARLADICYMQEDYELRLEYTNQELVQLNSAEPRDCERVLRCVKKLDDVKKKLHT